MAELLKNEQDIENFMWTFIMKTNMNNNNHG